MRRYSEFEFEKMKRDYELISEWERHDEDGKGDGVEDALENWKPIQIKYIDSYEYEDYENFFKIIGAKINRRNSAYRLDKDLCICDYVCKVLISYHANKGALITPAQLYNNKYIRTGRYTEWKGQFLNSVLAKHFDVEPQKYKMGDIGELLDNPTTCMLILHNYVEEREIDADQEDNIWFILGKIIDAYSKEKVSVGLNKAEKNILSVMLIGEGIGQMSYLESRPLQIGKSIHVYGKEKQKEFIDKIKNIKTDELLDKSVNQKNKDNKDDRQFYFSDYLSPIMAALCEYWQNNPFYVPINIWKELSNIQPIKIAGVDNDQQEKLSLEYAKFDRYFKYKIAVSNMKKQEDFLCKYNVFTYQLINKVLMWQNPCKGTRKYIQYYLIEKMIGLQLFETETEVICNNIERLQEEVNIDNFNRKHNKLKLILKKIYEFQGVISRTAIAKSAIDEYFDIYRTGKFKKNYGDEVREILKKIEYAELIFRLRERLYLEDLVQDSNLQIEPYEKENVEQIKKSLKEYDEYAECIKREKIIRKREGYLTTHQIQDMVKRQTKDNEQREEIKKWVIYASVL